MYDLNRFAKDGLDFHRRLSRPGDGDWYEVVREADGALILGRLFRSSTATAATIDAVLAQAQALSATSHPVLLPLLGSGIVHAKADHARYAYTVTESHPPEAVLRAGLSDQPLPVDAAVGPALAILECLQALGGQGAWHGHVGPDTVVVTEDGRCRLIHPIEARLLLATAPEAMAGQSRCLAPEIVQGVQAGDLASDLFGLAALVYRSLTGAFAFPDDSVFTLPPEMLGTLRPADPRLANPAISEYLALVLAHGLSLDRSSRYQRPADMARDLLLVMKGKPPVHATTLWAGRQAWAGAGAPAVPPPFTAVEADNPLAQPGSSSVHRSPARSSRRARPTSDRRASVTSSSTKASAKAPAKASSTTAATSRRGPPVVLFVILGIAALGLGLGATLVFAPPSQPAPATTTPPPPAAAVAPAPAPATTPASVPIAKPTPPPATVAAPPPVIAPPPVTAPPTVAVVAPPVAEPVAQPPPATTEPPPPAVVTPPPVVAEPVVPVPVAEPSPPTPPAVAAPAALTDEGKAAAQRLLIALKEKPLGLALVEGSRLPAPYGPALRSLGDRIGTLAKTCEPHATAIVARKCTVLLDKQPYRLIGIGDGKFQIEPKGTTTVIPTAPGNLTLDSLHGLLDQWDPRWIGDDGLAVRSSLAALLGRDPGQDPPDAAAVFRDLHRELGGGTTVATSAPAPAKDPKPTGGKAPTEGLVGHWTLDEAKGDSFAGAAGQPSLKAVEKDQWKLVEGHTGKGVQVTPGPNKDSEADGHLLVDGTGNAASKACDGSFTISVWYKPLSVPTDKDGKSNRNRHGIVIRPGWHCGLSYGNNRKFVATMPYKGANGISDVSATSDNVFEPNAFHHLAMTSDRKAGLLTLWIDGSKAGQGKFDTGVASFDYKDPWFVGIGKPKAKEYRWPAHGVIDDLRIYNRALTADEVKALASP